MTPAPAALPSCAGARRGATTRARTCYGAGENSARTSEIGDSVNVAKTPFVAPIGLNVDVTAGKSQGKLSLRVGNPLGDRDTDSIKVKCLKAVP